MDSFFSKLLKPTVTRISGTVVLLIVFFILGLLSAFAGSSYASTDRFLHWFYFVCFVLLAPGFFLFSAFLPALSLLALPFQFLYCYFMATGIAHLIQKWSK